MPAKTYNDILSDLKKKNYKPVYFITGEETYFLDFISDEIENNVLDESEKAFNQTIFYGKDSSISQVINQCNRFPMMAERQVVILKEAQECKDLETNVPAKKDGKNVDINLLEEYLKKPNPTTLFLICYKYKKLDGRKSLGKNISKFSEYFFSEKIKDNQVAAWIKNKIEGQNIEINDKDCNLMAAHLGNDLNKISNEIRKLIIAIDGRKKITDKDIEEYVGISKEYNVFEFLDAVLTCDFEKSFRIAHYFGKTSKTNAFPYIISVLYNNFSSMIVYHSLEDKSKLNVQAALKMNPWALEKLIKGTYFYNYEKTVNALHHIRLFDMKFKGVDALKISETDLFTELLFRIMPTR